ncbi:MAG: fibronectin type III domain-containing protein, partial [Gemmatimonadetes bacterium]|nr:fibronectin type III domain-containing protein [Gemmatimonadota bacterium]
MPTRQYGPRRIRPLGLTTIAVVALLVGACDSQRIIGPTSNVERLGPQQALTASPTSVEFYIHAHQDDWQLFMGDRVYYALQGGNRVVFVYATAGDAGLDQRYWETREAAAQASVDSIAGAGSWTCASQTIATHAVRRCTKGKTVSYYLRMPGGNGSDGMGYGKGSLVLLRDSARVTTAIDGSTTYVSWSDFHNTIAGIVDLESSDPTLVSVKVHAPDYNRTLNPGDHPDHWATADAVQAAAALRGWSMSWYVDYEIRRKSINLSAFDQAIKQKEFYAYDDVMLAAGYETLKNDTWYQAWLWRTYFRVEQPAAPKAPSNLTVTAVASSQIDLSWKDNASNESGFKIERAPDDNGVAGTYTQIATAITNVTSYSDTGLGAGTRYWYRVRAHNGGGHSGYSNAAAATTLVDPQPPASATSLVATANSPTQVDLTWNPGSGATSHKLHRSTVSGFTPNESNRIATVGAVGSHSDLSAQQNTTYYYLVVASNSTGDAPPSNEASATTPGMTQSPSAPTSLVATAVSMSQINLTWTDNASNESGFKIERAPDNNGAPGAYTQIATVGANTTSYSNTGLSAGTRYWYRVRAYNADGDSGYSNESSATTNDTPPSSLTVKGYTSGGKGKGANKADLSWTRGTGALVDVWRNNSKIAAGVSNAGS